MKTLYTLTALILMIGLSSFTSQVTTPSHTTVQTAGTVSNFRVHRQHYGAAMFWTTSAEDVSYYIVERSYDGEFYEPAAELTAQGAGRYTYLDQEVFPGLVHYRIRSIRMDGSDEYSVTASVHIVKRG